MFAGTTRANESEASYELFLPTTPQYKMVFRVNIASKTILYHGTEEGGSRYDGK